MAEQYGLDSNNRFGGLLEEKVFDHLDFVFPFLAAFIDSAMGEQHCNTQGACPYHHFQAIHLLNCKHMEHVQTLHRLNTIQYRIRIFKTFPKNTFDVYFETSLYTLKFHRLDLGRDVSDRFGAWKLLSSPSYQRLNVYNKRAYRSAP